MLNRLGKLPLLMIVTYRHIPVVVHSPKENCRAFPKGSRERVGIVVPLPGTERDVPTLLEILAEHQMRAGNILTVSFYMKECPSSVYHCPTWHTYRIAHAAHEMHVSHNGASLGEIVHGWGTDVGIVKRTDSIVSLIGMVILRCSFYCFTAPAARPETSWRWMTKKNIKVGIVATTEAVITLPHWVVY